MELVDYVAVTSEKMKAVQDRVEQKENKLGNVENGTPIKPRLYLFILLSLVPSMPCWIRIFRDCHPQLDSTNSKEVCINGRKLGLEGF